MLRRLAALLTALLTALPLAAVVGLPGAPSAALAQQDQQGQQGQQEQQDEQTGETPLSDPAAAEAWVLADADTGAVLAALNHHEPHEVASLVKVMTALVTLEQLQLDNEVVVSERAAEQPAMRIGLEAGQSWELEHLLHSLLMVSANDAAYALAEAVSGDLEEFAHLMQQTADRLEMQDSTWLDPAGFDGEEGFEGGTRASAYDLAVLARNALDVPEIMEIASKPVYEFDGGDGEPHRLVNHNKLLETFPGLTGLKTGYTQAAGHTLLATAERDGRRLIAVVIDATDHYGTAAALLDQGFNTPPSARGTGEVLPEPMFDGIPTAADEQVEQVAETDEEATDAGAGVMSTVRRLATVLAIGLAIAFFLRREQIKRRKQRRRAMRRAYLDAQRRGMIDVIDAERYYGPEASVGGAGVAREPGHVQVIEPAATRNGHQRTHRRERPLRAHRDPHPPREETPTRRP